jgi:cysteine-rich PDZ-binding protein
MVCTKCQKTIKQTELATPAVKRKNDMYYGSPAGDKNKATLGGGISKVGFNDSLKRYLLPEAD